MSKSKVIYLVKMFRMRVVSRKPRNKSHTISRLSRTGKPAVVHYMDTGRNSVGPAQNPGVRHCGGQRQPNDIMSQCGSRPNIFVYAAARCCPFCLTFWRYRVYWVHAFCGRYCWYDTVIRWTRHWSDCPMTQPTMTKRPKTCNQL